MDNKKKTDIIKNMDGSDYGEQRRIIHKRLITGGDRPILIRDAPVIQCKRPFWVGQKDLNDYGDLGLPLDWHLHGHALAIFFLMMCGYQLHRFDLKMNYTLYRNLKIRERYLKDLFRRIDMVRKIRQRDSEEGTAGRKYGGFSVRHNKKKYQKVKKNEDV